MIFLERFEGRLANQLWGYASFHAFCKQNKIKYFWNIHPKYAKYFVAFQHPFATLRFRLGWFFARSAWVLSFILPFKIKKLKRWFDYVADEIFLKYAQNGLLLLISGYSFGNLVPQYAKEIKEKFKLNEKYQAQLREKLSLLKDQNPMLVGVHVRRGDYADWKDGKFFVSVQKYGEYMLQFQRLAPQKVRFCVVSDDFSLTPQDFGQSNLDIKIATTSEIIDLYLLANCNYIMGANSTYSSWASFFGDVPKFTITNNSLPIENLAQFEIYKGEKCQEKLS